MSDKNCIYIYMYIHVHVNVGKKGQQSYTSDELEGFLATATTAYIYIHIIYLCASIPYAGTEYPVVNKRHLNNTPAQRLIVNVMYRGSFSSPRLL